MFSFINNDFGLFTGTIPGISSSGNNQEWSWIYDYHDYNSGFQKTVTDTGWKLTKNIPGIDPETLLVEVEGGYLRVSGGTKEDRFEVKYPLSDKIDTEGITSSCKFGVLTLQLPTKKPPEREVYKIQVKVE